MYSYKELPPCQSVSFNSESKIRVSARDRPLMHLSFYNQHTYTRSKWYRLCSSKDNVLEENWIEQIDYLHSTFRERWVVAKQYMHARESNLSWKYRKKSELIRTTRINTFGFWPHSCEILGTHARLMNRSYKTSSRTTQSWWCHHRLKLISSSRSRGISISWMQAGPNDAAKPLCGYRISSARLFYLWSYFGNVAQASEIVTSEPNISAPLYGDVIHSYFREFVMVESKPAASADDTRRACITTSAVDSKAVYGWYGRVGL